MKTNYTRSELLYMLEGDTTVYRGYLLDNENVCNNLQKTIDGKMSYKELLNKVYEEF